MGLCCCKFRDDDDRRFELKSPAVPTETAYELQDARPEQRGEQLEKVNITKKDEIIIVLLRKLNVKHIPYIPPNEAYILETPSQKCYDYVLTKFAANPKFISHYYITKVQRVWNPFLMSQYALVLKQGCAKLKEYNYFHGTGSEAAKMIMTYNFDWREVRDPKWGWGVYFANNPWLASHYSKRHQRGDEDYQMFLVKVLLEVEIVSDLSVGSRSTKVPVAGYSTRSEDSQEIVKYDYAMFYPEFLVNFRALA